MTQKKTHLIRINENVKQALEPLRHQKYAKGKLSYNDSIGKLLFKVDEVKREHLCKDWIQSGQMKDLEKLLETLKKIYEANYDPDDRFKLRVTVF